MPNSVGLVLVSHSLPLAAAVETLVRQMAGPAVRIALAAGAGKDRTELGTDATAILSAIASLDNDAGTLVLMDIGSALLSAELALDLLEPDMRARVALCPAPFVEGALAAGVAASGGAPLAHVRHEAEQALAAKQTHLNPPDAPGPEANTNPAPTATLLVSLTDPAGLHLRPAAAIARYARNHPHSIRVALPDTGRSADAASLTALLALGARTGALLEITTGGTAADLDAIAAILSTTSQSAPDADPSPPRAVSPGLAIGPAATLTTALAALPDRTTRDPITAIAALDTALAQARAQPAMSHDILAAQRALLDDPALRDEAIKRITRDHLDAATAWARTIESAADAIARLDDPTLAARAVDLRDAATPVLHALGVAPTVIMPAPGAILIVDDFPTSLAARLTRDQVQGVIDRVGSPTSHAAILLRAAGIPYLVGAGPITIADGTMLAFDGSTGRIWHSPDAPTLARLRAQAHADAPGTTPTESGTLTLVDGSTVEFWANVASVAQAEAARRANAVGIGLLRTEFLFMDRATTPSIDEQVALLRTIIAPMQGRPVVIRALDAGADKPLAFLPVGTEPNPALGQRGLRALLAHPDLFEAQLRAMLCAGHGHDLRIMLPMVTNPSELAAARTHLVHAHVALDQSGIRHAWPVPLGIMIEVPAAALTVESFATADFVSIGTNDLTQYTLAADRVNSQLALLGDARHAAVLSLCARIATHAPMPVTVCGEAAGDPLIAPVLVTAGLRRLSMAPGAFVAIRRALATPHEIEPFHWV
jgi:phosphocarrier protein FPr